MEIFKRQTLPENADMQSAFESGASFYFFFSSFLQLKSCMHDRARQVDGVTGVPCNEI